MNARTDGTTGDYSRATGPDSGSQGASAAGFSRLDRALVAVAVVGCALLVLADFSTLYSVSVPGVPGRSISGHHQHAWALALAGAFGVLLAYSAAQGTRIAMLGLCGIALLALGIVFFADLPDVHATGVFGAVYANAQASPSAGFYEETLGAALGLIGGGGLLLLEG